MADKTNSRAKLFWIIPLWYMKNIGRVYFLGAIPLWKKSADRIVFDSAMEHAKMVANATAAEKAKAAPDPDAVEFWKTYTHGAKKGELKRQGAIEAARGDYSADEIGKVYDLCSKNKRLNFNTVMVNLEGIMINTGKYTPAAAVAALETGMKKAKAKDFAKYMNSLDAKLPAYVNEIEGLCAQSKGSMNAKKIGAFEVLSNLEQIKKDTNESNPVEAAKAYIRAKEIERATRPVVRMDSPATGNGTGEVKADAAAHVVAAPAIVPEAVAPQVVSASAAKPVVAQPAAAKPERKGILARIGTGFAAIAASVAALGIWGSKNAAAAPIASGSAVSPIASGAAVASSPMLVPFARVKTPPMNYHNSLTFDDLNGESAYHGPQTPVADAHTVTGAVVPPVETVVPTVPPVEAVVPVVPPVEQVIPAAVAPVAKAGLGAMVSNSIAAGLAALVLIGSLMLPGRIGKENYQPPQPAPIVVVQPSENIEVKVLPWANGGDTAFSTVEGIAVEQVRVQLGMEKLNPQDVKKGDEARAVRQLVKDIASKNNLKNPDLIQKGSTLKVNRQAVMTTAERFGQFAR
ncbi:Uncharacterised protein [Candidatus Anstonella stagnisolia]|nr:Uncharacterised protein [Candidatus Anstonella stagnisolia]